MKRIFLTAVIAVGLVACSAAPDTSESAETSSAAISTMAYDFGIATSQRSADGISAVLTTDDANKTVIARLRWDAATSQAHFESVKYDVKQVLVIDNPSLELTNKTVAGVHRALEQYLTEGQSDYLLGCYCIWDNIAQDHCCRCSWSTIAL